LKYKNGVEVALPRPKEDEMEKTWYKVYVPINDENGNVVDFFREDWHENDSPEAAGKQGYLMACEETWGENNEFLPSPENIEVYNNMDDNDIIISVDVILSNLKSRREKI
jgi:hypothetical protein